MTSTVDFAELRPGACWWCGNTADSREHKVKRSDLVREYGKPPYRGQRTLTHFTSTGRRDFQGPGSGLVKFGRSLCAACNNARSQPFDRAWDRVGAYLDENEATILATRRLDFQAVFGAAWEAAIADVSRYLVKHLVCRIVDELPGPVRLDPEMLMFLDGGSHPATLSLDFCLDRGIADMLALTRSAPPPDEPKAAEAGFLGLTGIHVMQRQTDGTWSEPQSGLVYRWLAIYWHVGERQAWTNFPARELELRESTEYFGPQVSEIFAIWNSIPAHVRNTIEPDGPECQKALTEAGYPEAAARLDALAEEFEEKHAVGATGVLESS
jgi:hypothetical protein